MLVTFIAHHTLISSLIKHTIECNTVTLGLSNLDMQIAIFIVIIVRTGRAQWLGLGNVTLLSQIIISYYQCEVEPE